MIPAEATATPSVYKSATCSLGAASAMANKFHDEGYDVLWTLAVVANDEEGKPIQAIYLLAKRREKPNESAEA